MLLYRHKKLKYLQVKNWAKMMNDPEMDLDDVKSALQDVVNTFVTSRDMAPQPLAEAVAQQPLADA